MREIFHRFAARAIGRLKLLDAVGIKENLHLIGKLDYPRKPIQMWIDSEAQIGRLTACDKEPETVAWLESSMRPGDVFFDVGANVGAYSFIADAAASEQARVFAFEPSFSTYAALVANIDLNRCSARITPLQLALADETKLVTLHHSNRMAGASLHGLGQAVNERGEAFVPALSQPVLAYRMDDFVRAFDVPAPTLLKIDVDGSELGVVRGAKLLLARRELRSVLVEIDERIETSRQVISEIERSGLSLTSRHPRRGPGVYNYIFDRRNPS